MKSAQAYFKMVTFPLPLPKKNPFFFLFHYENLQAKLMNMWLEHFEHEHVGCSFQNFLPLQQSNLNFQPFVNTLLVFLPMYESTGFWILALVLCFCLSLQICWGGQREVFGMLCDLNSKTIPRKVIDTQFAQLFLSIKSRNDNFQVLYMWQIKLEQQFYF